MKLGMGELLIIFIVAIIVVGPDKLPEYARKFGQALRSFRDATGEATQEIRENVIEPLNEAQKPLREAMEPVEEMRSEINEEIQDVNCSFQKMTKPLQSTKSAKRTAKSPGKEDAAEVEDGAGSAGWKEADAGEAALGMETEVSAVSTEMAAAEPLTDGMSEADAGESPMEEPAAMAQSAGGSQTPQTSETNM